jgi:predicted enzyme related to lactoylglutathione lyase
MTSGMKTLIIPVKDIGTAKQLYGALLGSAPTMDQPYYVGFDLDDQHVGLDPNGHGSGMTGPLAYWHVEDINATVDALVRAGGESQQPVRDVGGGKLIATVTDADGNVVGLLQPATGGWA